MWQPLAQRKRWNTGGVCWVELRILSPYFLPRFLFDEKPYGWEDGSNLEESTTSLARQSYAAAGSVQFYVYIVCGSRYTTAMAMIVLILIIQQVNVFYLILHVPQLSCSHMSSSLIGLRCCKWSRSSWGQLYLHHTTIYLQWKSCRLLVLLPEHW